MKITKRQLKKIIREAQWGNFTGRAAPLDMPMRDSGPVPKDQLRKLADIFINDMGMTPEEVLQNSAFIEAGITDLAQLSEGKTRITKRQLRRIIREAITEAKDKPLQKLAKGVEERGTEGEFSKWCGEAGVTQACIDRAAKEGGKRAKQANLAVTFSKAKGGGPSLTYPKKKKK